jgi:hypothetical protein
MKPRQIIMIVVGSLCALLGFAVAAGAAAIGWGLSFERDSNGFFTTPTDRFATTTFALTTKKIDLGDPTADSGWENRKIATVRIRATASGDRPLFVGIGPERAVEQYLQDVRHDEISDVEYGPFRASYSQHHVTATGSPAVPTAQTFWVAQSVGTSATTVWEVKEGEWSVVVMNSDASSGVSADIQVGAKIAWLGPLAIALAVGATLLLISAVALIIGGAASGSRGGIGGAVATSAVATSAVAAGAVAASAAATAAVSASRSSPVTLTGHLDPSLSRWQWLVKWFLAIPHIIILVFLWAVFAVLSVVAFFAILFTGRYPRSIFTFNVGVMRWSWRVGFYANSALGTDRYPPFTLADADYPAHLDIEYPERLSQGLVLVKSWLLAIPHLIIVGIFTSGATWMWSWGRITNTGSTVGGGLIGVLCFVAGVVLLFSGKYPRGLFDVIMGFNRWVYRVIAYVALMTDAYPPFRLDQGPDEPASGPWTPGPPSGGAASSLGGQSPKEYAHA